ncbi:DUF624 domain-containing protein [Marinilactibacillus kalidii]|uniref:DUF624 domain-containing protein n=1 Tax=Marinilactibacillus kalidii TaxID=2820274 RepID=UPI001ABDE175|nr:DUF624 domain-containing protein [Marinilactibacillus kalidii]
MKGLINPDSKLHYYVSMGIDCFLMNMLFILTCVPLFSIGASMIALSRVTMGMVQGNLSFPIKTYLIEWKKNFVRGTLIQLLLMIVGTILFLAIRFLFFLPVVSFVIMGTGILLASISFIIVSIYIFQYTARYDNRFWNSLKVVYQIAVDNPKETAGMLITLLTVLAMMSLSPLWGIMISFFYFFVGFALTSLFLSYRTLRVFTQYEG